MRAKCGFAPAALALLTVLSAPLLSGCSTHVAFTYPLDPDIRQLTSNPPNVKIAVLPARDSRKTKNNSASYFFSMVPLFPFGWVNYHRPEAATRFNTIDHFEMNLKEDLAKSIAQHWREAGVARNVFFDYGGMADTADFTLHIEVQECRYQGKIYSYLIGPFGRIFWWFGFPIGSSKVRLNLGLTLKDRDGATVWSDQISEKWGRVQGLLYRQGRDMEGVARGLQDGLNRSLSSNAPKFAL